jgi:hypothetical protein
MGRALVAVVAALALVLLGGCPTYDVLVVRYAARDHGCAESRTSIISHIASYRWRLNVCGETRTYESSGHGADDFRETTEPRLSASMDRTWSDDAMRDLIVRADPVVTACIATARLPVRMQMTVDRTGHVTSVSILSEHTDAETSCVTAALAGVIARGPGVRLARDVTARFGEGHDGAPVHGRPSMPADALGFRFGSTRDEARAACVAAGETWGDSLCSGPAADIGHHGAVAARFCDGALCSLLFIDRASTDADVTVSFRDLRRALTDRYGTPLDRRATTAVRPRAPSRARGRASRSGRAVSCCCGRSTAVASGCRYRAPRARSRSA